MTPRLTHICRHVELVEDCARFFQRYCGLEVIADRTTGALGSAYLGEPGREDGVVFQLMGGGEHVQLDVSDNGHLGCVVATRDAVDALADRARQDACLVWAPDAYLEGAYLCTVRDPNGEFVEFSVGHPMPPTARVLLNLWERYLEPA